MDRSVPENLEALSQALHCMISALVSKRHPSALHYSDVHYQASAGAMAL